MPRPRRRSGSYPPRGPSRGAPPTPTRLRCRSPASQSPPLRLFGAEITNRLATPPAPQGLLSITDAPPDAATATLCRVAVAAPQAHAPLEPTPLCSWRTAGPHRIHSGRSGGVQHLPSLESLLGAMSGVTKREGQPLLTDDPPCSRSSSSDRSDASFGILLPMETVVGGAQWLFEPARSGASAQTEVSTQPARDAKRLLRDSDFEDGGGRAAPPSSSPQAKRQRVEGAAVDGPTGAFRATRPLPERPISPVEEGDVRVRSGEGAICGGGGGSAGSDAEPALLAYPSEDRVRACGFLTPVSKKLLCLPAAPLPPSQHIHARACRPASLLDREHATPSWQVLTSAPTMLEEEEGDGLTPLVSTSSNTALLSPARCNVLLRNAVDSSIIYPLQTLDDISPILCLSAERLERRRMSAVTCGQHLPTEMEDEERRACDAFVPAALSAPYLPCRALIPAEGGDDNEDMRGAATNLPTQRSAESASFVHEEALRLLTATCKGAGDDSLQWTG
ncbi:hypothetical protein LSCM1_03299 [Leishmania martiniquensis]|uniref:Uncharacterized protein n=1 Tax=Leishmania martiniquensis TaxID=1580590 RepID=A0A836H3I1_9TRYP|nr:hypothetical protein LSCM1_03299 [Leishmania martiniquensis]